MLPRLISRTRKFAIQLAFRSIIRNGQDAYTLVLEMSRPEPNIQIAISIVENSPDSGDFY